MKRLIFLGGPMGVGKTTAARLLMDRMDRAVWLDGDWCWQQGRVWSFGSESRAMVLDNICHLLSNFLRNPDFDTVLFTWVLHTRALRDLILERLPAGIYHLTDLSLVCGEGELRRRLTDRGADEETIQRAVSRLACFPVPGAETVDTTGVSPHQVADCLAESLGLPKGAQEAPLDLDDWLSRFLGTVSVTFGDRLKFVGLQGSRGRGEARPDSDIDMVVILDRLTPPDLAQYRTAVAALPHRELLCGFVSGWEELMAWDRAELFQFCLDTKPLLGALEEVLAQVGEEDIRRSVHTGACAIYHGCIHNLLHERSTALLASLCKSAIFILQALRYLERGTYCHSRRELIVDAAGDELAILRGEERLRRGDPVDFEGLSGQLLIWSGALIRGEESH